MFCVLKLSCEEHTHVMYGVFYLIQKWLKLFSIQHYICSGYAYHIVCMVLDTFVTGYLYITFWYCWCHKIFFCIHICLPSVVIFHLHEFLFFWQFLLCYIVVCSTTCPFQETKPIDTGTFDHTNLSINRNSCQSKIKTDLDDA